MKRLLWICSKSELKVSQGIEMGIFPDGTLKLLHGAEWIVLRERVCVEIIIMILTCVQFVSGMNVLLCRDHNLQLVPRAIINAMMMAGWATLNFCPIIHKHTFAVHPDLPEYNSQHWGMPLEYLSENKLNFLNSSSTILTQSPHV